MPCPSRIWLRARADYFLFGGFFHSVTKGGLLGPPFLCSRAEGGIATMKSQSAGGWMSENDPAQLTMWCVARLSGLGWQCTGMRPQRRPLPQAVLLPECSLFRTLPDGGGKRVYLTECSSRAVQRCTPRSGQTYYFFFLSSTAPRITNTTTAPAMAIMVMRPMPSSSAGAAACGWA